MGISLHNLLWKSLYLNDIIRFLTRKNLGSNLSCKKKKNSDIIYKQLHTIEILNIKLTTIYTSNCIAKLFYLEVSWLPLALLLLLLVSTLAMDNGSVYEKETNQSVRERVRVCQRDGEYIYIFIWCSIDEECLNTSIEALFTN